MAREASRAALAEGKVDISTLAEGERYIKGAAAALPRDTHLDMQSTRMQADSSSAAHFKVQQHFGLYSGEVVGADNDENCSPAPTPTATLYMQ
jgi:hypothetical protein